MLDKESHAAKALAYLNVGIAKVESGVRTLKRWLDGKF